MKKVLPFFLILIFVFSIATVSVFADEPASPGGPEGPDEPTILQTPPEDDNTTNKDFYTIINGYGQGYVLGYPGLNNTGDIFPIAVKNVVTGKIIPSFCAHAGSRNFAGESGLGCSGYLVAGPNDLYELEGVDFSVFVSAYNYIADFYGKLDDNRALTQVVTWVLLDSIDIDSAAFDAIEDWKLDKDAVRDVIENYPGYAGNGNIAKIIYLLCEHHHDPVNCQPQLVPIYSGGEWKPGTTEEPEEPDDDGDDGDDGDGDNNNNNNNNNNDDDGDDVDDGRGRNYSEDDEIPDELDETTSTRRSSSSTNRNNSTNSDDNDASLPAEPLDRGDSNNSVIEDVELDENPEVPLSESPEEPQIDAFAAVPTSSMPQTGLSDSLWLYLLGLIISAAGLAVCLVSVYRTKRVRD